MPFIKSKMARRQILGAGLAVNEVVESNPYVKCRKKKGYLLGRF